MKENIFITAFKSALNSNSNTVSHEFLIALNIVYPPFIKYPTSYALDPKTELLGLACTIET